MKVVAWKIGSGMLECQAINKDKAFMWLTEIFFVDLEKMSLGLSIVSTLFNIVNEAKVVLQR